MKNDPKILIYGFGSVLNYGGEAIVQGTCRMLFETWPDAQITIATEDIESTKNVLDEHSNITIIQSHQRVTLYRLFKGILKRLGMGSGSPVRVNLKIIDGHDIFLSVGGDNFVQTPEKSISLLLEDLMEIGNIAKKKGILYCVWGASVGPFEDPACFKKIATHLKNADLITAREIKAQEYLNTMGCTNNVVLVGDPAFYMEPKDSGIVLSKTEGEIRIGVNLSLLAINTVFGDEYKEQQMSLLAQDINGLFHISSKVKIILIPHVVSSVGGSQDDYGFLNELKSILTYQDRIFMPPYGLGSKKTKGLMQQCDVILAARMHCFVGSVSAGTPALMIAYSDKGYGMTRYVYGNEEWVVGLDSLTPEILQEKITTMLKNRHEVHAYLEENRSLWQSDAKKAIAALYDIYTKGNNR